MHATLLAAANGMLVTLAPPVRLNLTASVSGGGSPWAGPPDTQFEIVDLGGGRVALKSAATGFFVCAENAGQAPLVCNRTEVREWETFELVDLGNTDIALRATVNGQFVCAESAGSRPLIANRSAVGPWETFRLSRSYPDDGLVHELHLTVTMGDDDLRGGRDNLDLRVDLRDGTRRHAPTINAGHPWEPRHWPRAFVVLDPPLAMSDIAALVLHLVTRGGIAGDNVDLVRVAVDARVGGGLESVAVAGPARLTADRPDLIIPVAHPASLVLRISTGDDDLRGGNDNLSVAVHRASGPNFTFANVNAGMPWRPGSLHTVPLDLGPGMAADDVVAITLTARLAGGWNGDNWDMEWLEGSLPGLGGTDGPQVVFRHGFKRFTGSDRELRVDRT